VRPEESDRRDLYDATTMGRDGPGGTRTASEPSQIQTRI